MTRNNKTTLWESFSADIIQQVWEKAQVVPGLDSDIFRKDKCGALISRKLFGANVSPLSKGWEIDHIKPISKGGTDDLINLQPLQWENNRHKSDSYPSWDCCVIAQGEQNKYFKN